MTCTINTVTNLLLTSEDIPVDTSSCRYLPKWTNIHLFPFWSLDFDTVNLMRTDRDEKCWHALPLALSTIKKTTPGYCRGSKTLIVHSHLAWMTAPPLRRIVDGTEPLKCLAYSERSAQGQWTEHIEYIFLSMFQTCVSPVLWVISIKRTCFLSHLFYFEEFRMDLQRWLSCEEHWLFQRTWVWFLALPWRRTTLRNSGCRRLGGGLCGHHMYMAHRQMYIQAKHPYL